MRNHVPEAVIDLQSRRLLRRPGSTSASGPSGSTCAWPTRRISARLADTREARYLAGRKGDPVLTMERTSYDDKGRAVEFGHHLYRPDLYAYEATLVDR